MSQERDVQELGIVWRLDLHPERGASFKKRPARAGQLEFWLGCERSCGVAVTLDVAANDEMQVSNNSYRARACVINGSLKGDGFRHAAQSHVGPGLSLMRQLPVCRQIDLWNKHGMCAALRRGLY